MKFRKLIILAGAAWAGTMVYKAQHAAPVAADSGQRSTYDSMTGAGSLLETFKSARAAHNPTGPSTASGSASGWQTGGSNGLGGVGNSSAGASFNSFGSAPVSMPTEDAELLTAAAKGDTKKVAARLAAGAKIDSRDAARRTPLMLASWYGNSEIISRLLAAGANDRLQDRDGHNAFDYAAGRGLVEVVRFLLERTHDEDEHYVEYATIIRATYAGNPALLPEGSGALASVNRLSPQGQAPLHIAAGNGSIALLEALAARSAKINLSSDDGQTPLHWAAWNNQPHAVTWLIVHGASLTQTDEAGNTALMLAAQNNSKDAAAVLLQSGAAKDVFNKEGRSAAMIATDKGYADLARTLQ